MGRGAGRGRMNRLCTLHGRPSFSEPRPSPEHSILTAAGGGRCTELCSGLSL